MSKKEIVSSHKLFLPSCNEDKIKNVLIIASTKAKDSGLQVVTVKGEFSDYEQKVMKIMMENKFYNMWKSEDGFIFTPIFQSQPTISFGSNILFGPPNNNMFGSSSFGKSQDTSGFNFGGSSFGFNF